jgi:hypothetical protein
MVTIDLRILFVEIDVSWRRGRTQVKTEQFRVTRKCKGMVGSQREKKRWMKLLCFTAPVSSWDNV